MFLGIDVGGTHTDAVLLTVENNVFSVVSWAKIDTNHDDVVASVRTAMEAVLRDVDPAGVSRFTLSSTLTTNALARKCFDGAALVIIPGPGLDAGEWTEGLPVFRLKGAMDHRGQETEEIDEKDLAELFERLISHDIRAVGVAGKFATRNPSHEDSVAAALNDIVAPDFVSLSHNVSGVLNFPRRATTTFYNAALWKLHNSFADAVLLAAATVGQGLEPRLLMAHGGSVPINPSRERCVEAANSGPAASVLGTLALEGKNFGKDETVLFCDIGGSTTDLALMFKGSPATTKEGLILGGRKTSVPGLATYSVPVGGDSPVLVDDRGVVSLGEQRRGPCLAMGGPVCALTDALNVLGHAQWGRVVASLDGIREIAEKISSAVGRPVSDMEAARMAAHAAGRRIKEAAAAFIGEINLRPIYTVEQILADEKAVPSKACVAGGAGPSMAATLEEFFALPVVVPGHASFANAIGAALARASAFASLYADTARGVMHLMPQGGTHAVPPGYTLEEAIVEAEGYLRERIRRFDPDAGDLPVDMVETDSFSMHNSQGERVGRTIRVLCRARPGLVAETASA